MKFAVQRKPRGKDKNTKRGKEDISHIGTAWRRKKKEVSGEKHQPRRGLAGSVAEAESSKKMKGPEGKVLIAALSGKERNKELPNGKASNWHTRNHDETYAGRALSSTGRGRHKGAPLPKRERRVGGGGGGGGGGRG